MMMVEQPKAPPKVKVTVQEPFRIVHETKAYTAGQTFSVDTVTAARWEQAGWIERVSSKS
jgi:hypothetical protein